jgi:hypothetical protein
VGAVSTPAFAQEAIGQSMCGRCRVRRCLNELTATIVGLSAHSHRATMLAVVDAH